MRENDCVVVMEGFESSPLYFPEKGNRIELLALLEYLQLRKCYLTDYQFLLFSTMADKFVGQKVAHVDVPSVDELDPKDYANGIWVISKTYELIRNLDEAQILKVYRDEYHIADLIVELDKKMPESEQLGETLIRARWVPATSNYLHVGDKVGFVSEDTLRPIREATVTDFAWREIQRDELNRPVYAELPVLDWHWRDENGKVTNVYSAPFVKKVACA